MSCLGAVMSEKIFQKLKQKTAFIAAFVIGLSLCCYAFENVVVSITAFAAAGFFNSVLYPIKSDALNQLIPSGQRATLISVDSMFFRGNDCAVPCIFGHFPRRFSKMRMALFLSIIDNLPFLC